MLHRIRSLQELDHSIAQKAQATPDLEHHLLFVMDAGQSEGLLVHVQKTLAKLELLPGGQAGCHYHHYDMVPDLPGEGLYRFCTARERAGHLPALMALDVTSCALGPQTSEMHALLSFVRDCQLSTLFLFIIDTEVEQQMALSQRLRAAVPVEGYRIGALDATTM